jgi:hypothetical protein
VPLGHLHGCIEADAMELVASSSACGFSSIHAARAISRTASLARSVSSSTARVSCHPASCYLGALAVTPSTLRLRWLLSTMQVRPHQTLHPGFAKSQMLALAGQACCTRDKILDASGKKGIHRIRSPRPCSPRCNLYLPPRPLRRRTSVFQRRKRATACDWLP